SFCVALYEAWYRARPGVGAGSERPGAQAPAGRPLQPRRRGVPLRLHRALVRGLSLDPAKRFGSMEQLLQELSWDPRRRWRAIQVAAVVATLATGSILGLRTLAVGPGQRCRFDDDPFSKLWEEQQRQAMREAFVATGKSYAADAFRSTESRIDLFEARWKDMRREACESRERGQQSDLVHGLRTACLERRRRELRALVGALLDAEAQVVTHAVEALESLTDELKACADVDSLLAVVPPPQGDKARAEVERLSVESAELKALFEAGRYAKARAVADRLIEPARAVGYRPLQAELSFMLASAQRELADHGAAAASFHRGAVEAEIGHDDVLAARAYLKLLEVAVYYQRRCDDAPVLQMHAEAAIERVGGPLALRGELEDSRAMVASVCGANREAIARSRNSLKMLEEALGPAHRQVILVHHFLGAILHTEGEFEEALAHQTTALDSWTRLLGSHHPLVAKGLNNVANTHLSLGELGRATELHQRALAIREEALGPEHPLTLWSHANLAEALSAQGHDEQAREKLRDLLPRVERVYGPQHHRTATCWTRLGSVLQRLGRTREALAAHQRALAIYEKSSGTESHAFAAVALLGVGKAYLSLQDPRSAMAALSPARMAMSRVGGYPIESADVEFTCARALWEGGEERDRAREQAVRARDRLKALKRPPGDLIAEIEGWLASRPAR
ncbi:MAG: tetratricopeptide repeat protein, partial [Deltaproteobacteria bacterium]|nr:tetratricopeptide repeat protein [Deltaproteobacteria bacterium]